MPLHRSKAALLAVTIPLVGLSACKSVTTGAETVAQLPRMAVSGTVGFFENIFTSPSLAVEAVEIGRSAQCNSTGREPALEFFQDGESVHAWEAARGVSFTPPGTKLAPGLYAIAEMGERNTGGYALAVSRQAALKDGVLYLKASFLVPGNSAMVTQVVTSPCSLVLLPTRPYSQVLLLDQTNKVRAGWTAPGLKG